jgi:hypothetical protein
MFVVCHYHVSCIFHPPNRSKIREFTSGCSNPSIFRKFKACKFLFNSQFPTNISIGIIFAIKRWYFKPEFMKSNVIVAYLTSSMVIPAMAIMLYRMAKVMVIKFRISRILIPIVIPIAESADYSSQLPWRLWGIIRYPSCVASNTPILSFVSYTSASISPVCLFTSCTKA